MTKMVNWMDTKVIVAFFFFFELCGRQKLNYLFMGTNWIDSVDTIWWSISLTPYRQGEENNSSMFSGCFSQVIPRRYPIP